MASEWANLIDAFGDLVYRCAWRILKDQHDAEDIFQDVFAHAWSNAEFANVTNQAAWLRCVTVRCSLNRLRRRRSVGLENTQIEDKRMPESAVEAAELQDVVRKAIADLPEQQRLSFSLKYFEEMSNAEIAIELKTTTSAVSSALHSARRTLALALSLTLKGD